MKISNGSKKRCREKFNYKGIDSLINKAIYLIEYDINAAISEFIYDYDNVKLYNVILFLLKENLNLKELYKFDYIDIDNFSNNPCKE